MAWEAQPGTYGRHLVQVVLEGGGLDEIAAEVAGLLDAAVVVSSAEGEPLASHGPAELVSVLRGSRRGGAVATVPASVPASPPGGHHAAVPVVAGGRGHGHIAAYRISGPFPDSHAHMLEWAAAVAALVITKQQAVAAVEGKYRADFLRDVLTGRAGCDRAAAHATALGWDLNRPVVAVVAELDGMREAAGEDGERAARDRFLAVWDAALRARDRKAALAELSTEVVAVVGAGPDGDASIAGEVLSGLSDNAGVRGRFSAGISRVVAGVADLPEAYRQAVRAVSVGRQLYGSGAISHFDQLGVYRLLSLVPDTAELHAFVRDTLGELARDDYPDAAGLRHTLQVLLETNLNVAETARQLHFHYNTLRYRINKLEKLLGSFTQDPHLRLNLTLALYVLRMRGI